MRIERQITGTKWPGSTIGEPSFAEVVDAIATAEDLPVAQKRHWPTSLRQMAVYLDRPLEMVPARMTAIGHAVRGLHPEVLGVNDKTFRNHRSNVKAALNWYAGQMPGYGRKAPMDVAYRDLLAGVGSHHVRDVLSPFFRFLTMTGIKPGDVRDRHVDEYAAWRSEVSFSPLKTSTKRQLVRNWNKCKEDVAGWPPVGLTVPPVSPGHSGPAWDNFPPELRVGIDAYCGRIAMKHTTAGGKIIKGCKPSTIATRRRELIAAVRAAVQSGIPLERLQSLPDLLRPDHVEAIIDFYWQKNGDTPSLYTIDLAWKFCALAQTDANLDTNDLERLDEIRLNLDQYRRSGLTEKNRELVRTVIHSDIWTRVVQLPQRLTAEASGTVTTQPLKAAVTAQMALAIRLLCIAPVRLQNLTSIELGFNLVRPGGRGSEYLLVFPDYDVKNGIPLEFPLDGETTAMIDAYVYRHRPTLMRGRNHDRLFPGDGKDQKDTKTLGLQISDRLNKLLGLKITPHQFRHAAAAIILQKEPGNYELVRRVLGHRNIQTTTNFYIGLESLAATRRFGEIVTQEIEPQASRADVSRRKRVPVRSKPAPLVKDEDNEAGS